MDARSYRTSFVFDAAGQQIAVVAANGGISTSLFDKRGMMVASQDPLSAFTSYQFDAVGNTILRTDAQPGHHLHHRCPQPHSRHALRR